MDNKFQRVASSKVLNDIADYLLYYRHTNVNDEISCLDEFTSGYIEVIIDDAISNNCLSERVGKRHKIYLIEKELKFKNDTNMKVVLDNLISLLDKTKYDEVINPKSILYLKSDIIFEIGFHTLLQALNYDDKRLPKHSKDLIIPNNFSIIDYTNSINRLYNEYHSHFESTDRNGIQKLEAIYKTSITKLTDDIIKTTRRRFAKNDIDKDKVLEYDQARDIDLLSKKILDLIEYIDNVILLEPDSYHAGVYNNVHINQISNDMNWTEEERNQKGPYAAAHATTSASLFSPIGKIQQTNASGESINVQHCNSNTATSSNHMQNIMSPSRGIMNQNQRSSTTSSMNNRISNHNNDMMNVYDTSKNFKDKYDGRDPLNDIIHQHHPTATSNRGGPLVQVQVSKQHMLVNRTYPRYRNVHSSDIRRDDDEIEQDNKQQQVEEDRDPFLSGNDDIDEYVDDDLHKGAIESLKAISSRKAELIARPIPNLSDSPIVSRLLGKKRKLTENGNRTKIPWAEDEENVLKEAVAKLQHEKNFWAIIRDDPTFGPVFRENRRTNVDLKDKWRNMGKAAVNLGDEI